MAPEHIEKVIQIKFVDVIQCNIHCCFVGQHISEKTDKVRAESSVRWELCPTDATHRNDVVQIRANGTHVSVFVTRGSC